MSEVQYPNPRKYSSFIKPLPGVTLTKRQKDNHRFNIQVGAIVSRLHRCSEGKLEMSPVQLKASQILLDKAVPNLQSIDATVHKDAVIDPGELEQRYQQALQQALASMPPERLQALLEGAQGVPALEHAPVPGETAEASQVTRDSMEGDSVKGE